MDVVTAFLYGDLEEEIYMKQPQGFEVPGHENLVCKLQKSIYGLKQAPRQWNFKIDEFLQRFGLKRCIFDPCVYRLDDERGQLWVAIYVDDLVITGSKRSLIDSLKKALEGEFRMKNLGEISHLLGMEVNQSNGELRLTQRKYTEKILKKFNLIGCSDASTPMEAGLIPVVSSGDHVTSQHPFREAIGSLMYLMTCTRPDIATPVSMLSRYLDRPTDELWRHVVRIFRYLKSTIDFGLSFREIESESVYGFCDSDFANDPYDRRSRSGFAFFIARSIVTWASRLQEIVTLSTAEAEYVALTEAVKEGLWIRNLLQELNVKIDLNIYMDNTAAIAMAQSSAINRRTKYIDARYHKVRELVEGGIVNLFYTQSNDNLADIFTKNLPPNTFMEIRQQLGVENLGDFSAYLAIECESVGENSIIGELDRDIKVETPSPLRDDDEDEEVEIEDANEECSSTMNFYN
jgi:hypothetical protein